MNIYQRINEVRKKAGYVQKDKRVQEGGGYMAVTHDAVTAMLRDALVESGIVITMSVTESSIADTGTTTAKGTPFIRYSARYEVRFVNVETPEDYLCINVESHALDVGDKAPGKAMSYAKKYAVLKTFEIETGEDDESREEQKARKAPSGSPAAIKQDAYESLDQESKAWIDNLAIEVVTILDKEDAIQANAHIAESLGNAENLLDLKTALWHRLDRITRTALKKKGV